MKDWIFEGNIERWDEGIPLGNGRLGTLVWGSPEKLILSLDRGDLWDTTPCPLVHRDEFTYANMVRLAREGKEEEIRRIFDTPYYELTPTKLPAGRIVLKLGEEKGMKGRLSLKRAEAALAIGGVRLQCFLHAGEEAGLCRISLPMEKLLISAEPPKVTQTLLGYPDPEQGEQVFERQRRLWFVQRAGKDFAYGVFLLLFSKGQETLLVYTVKQAKDPGTLCSQAWQKLEELCEKGYEAALEEHGRWWDSFWSRSGLSLPSPFFEANWYMTQYLLGSCSRKGGYPMPLQGVWTADDGTLPPWKGDYHHDLNTQLSYLPYLKANHLEEGECFLDYLWELRDCAREFARTFYGVGKGICLPAVMSIDGQPLGGWGMYALSPTNQIWLAELFVRHYELTGDEEFLRERAYPYLQETAECIECLLEERDGKLYLPISSSPEIHDDHIESFLTPNSNYDLALMRWMFGALERLAPLAGENGNHYKEILRKLPALAVREDGILLLSPDEAIGESHRHHSNLMAIHPLRLFDDQNPEERKIIETNLLDLERRGTGLWCGYSYAWVSELYAVHHNGEAAARALSVFWQDFCSPNGFHLNGDYKWRGSSSLHYRPFTLEGNMCAADALQEMLLQERDGVLELFPAIPEEWKEKGCGFHTFRSANGTLVSAELLEGRVEQLTLTCQGSQKVFLKKIPELAAIAEEKGWKEEAGRYVFYIEGMQSFKRGI